MLSSSLDLSCSRIEGRPQSKFILTEEIVIIQINERKLAIESADAHEWGLDEKQKIELQREQPPLSPLDWTSSPFVQILTCDPLYLWFEHQNDFK